MKKITSLFVLFFILNTINAVPIGQWNAFLAYRNITDIEPAGNTIYVLSSNNLFSYNVNDHSINTYSKVFPLSDTGIRNIAWCNSANRLIIIYDNYNIDLLDNNQHVINVSGYMKASISQDKQINKPHYILLFISTCSIIIKDSKTNCEYTVYYSEHFIVCHCDLVK